MTDEGSQDKLRAAWRATSGDDLLSRLSRMSIEEMASRADDARSVLSELRDNSRVTLDIAVDGAGVAENEAPALPVGRLMARSARAVKELAKQAVGTTRRSDRLLVAALEPGSVRVIFRAPAAPDREGTLPIRGETAEGLALVELAALMNHAAADDAGQLVVAVHGLKRPSRDAVRMVAKTLHDAGWSITGELRLPGSDTVPVSLTSEAAGRLMDAANDLNEDLTRERIHGQIDGWTWSSGILAFIPDKGLPFRASVPPEMHTFIAEQNARKAQGTAALRVLVRYPSGDMGSPSRSYVLERFDPAMQPQPFELDDLP